MQPGRRPVPGRMAQESSRTPVHVPDYTLRSTESYKRWTAAAVASDSRTDAAAAACASVVEEGAVPAPRLDETGASWWEAASGKRWRRSV
jgi:hypothetical protein